MSSSTPTNVALRCATNLPSLQVALPLQVAASGAQAGVETGLAVATKGLKKIGTVATMVKDGVIMEGGGAGGGDVEMETRNPKLGTPAGGGGAGPAAGDGKRGSGSVTKHKTKKKVPLRLPARRLPACPPARLARSACPPHNPPSSAPLFHSHAHCPLPRPFLSSSLCRALMPSLTASLAHSAVFVCPILCCCPAR